VRVGDLNILLAHTHFKHLLQKLLHDVLGGVRREEAVRSVGVGRVVFQAQKYGVWILLLSVEGSVPLAIDLFAKRVLTASFAFLVLAVLLQGLLAVLFGLRGLLVLLMACFELSAHFSGSGVFALLNPGMSDDIGNG